MNELPDLRPRADVRGLVIEITTAVAGLCAASLLVLALVIA